MKTTHIVVAKSANMPASCWGRYGKVAVLKVPEGVRPGDVSMISERSRNVIEVVQLWDKLNIGSTDKCAFAIAKKEADELAAKLNERATNQRSTTS